MRVTQAVRWLAVAALLLTGVWSFAGAQESDPAARSTGDNPSQYAFYPADVAQPGGDLPGNPAIQLVKVTDGLFEPVNVAAPDDGSGRVFVVERGGRIMIVDAQGTLRPEPFLDVSGETEFQFLEEGLLGLAFHPDFAENGLFYINYTNQLRNGDVLTVQYQVSADDPDRADPASAIIISERDQPYPNHIGGDIAFGPDGYLYIGTGDGGLEGDPLDSGQDLSTPLSKILRIDVSPAVAVATGGTPAAAAVGGHAYLIPPDNPFVQGDVLIDLFDATEEDFARLHPNALPETWAYGLRNPWSFSFDRETGDFWIADVGQNYWEEVNMQPAGSPGGQNYGWKFLQGSHCFPYSIDPDCPHVGTLPVAEYSHDLGCTIVGGSVYRGTDYADLDGIYFNADYCTGRVFGLARDASDTWQYAELLNTGLLITGSGEDEAGNIYFTSCSCGYGQNAPHESGTIWMLVDANQLPDGAELAPTSATTSAGTLVASPVAPVASPVATSPAISTSTPTPAPSPTAAATVTPSPTATATPAATGTPTPAPTLAPHPALAAASPEAAPSRAASPIASPALVPVATPVATEAPTPSPTATPTPSPSLSPSPISSPAPSPVASPEASPEASPMASPAASPAASGTFSAQNADVTIESYDFFFIPRALTIPANQDVTIALPNNGLIPHNFSIEGTDVDIDFGPGEAPVITVNLAPGTYRYYCNIPGHAAAGMEGILTVQ